jgi:PBP1b-binding outer membrane lipoprotein LpoB
MKKLCFLLAAALAPALITGCSNSGVKTVNEEAGEKGGQSGTLTFEDCDKVIKGLLNDLFKRGILVKKDGTRYVLAIGTVKKDASIDIDKDQIIWNLRSELTNSGQVAVTSAVAADKENVSTLVAASNTPTVQPDLTIDGKITRQTKNTSGGGIQVEYYIQLKITDLKTGLDFWNKQERVVKTGNASEMRATLGAP